MKHNKEEIAQISEEERVKRIETSSILVGKAVFNSILITLVSFAPILFLEGQENKLFTPLVLTKTFAMIGSALVAIFLVPVLMVMLLKGKMRSEKKHPDLVFSFGFIVLLFAYALHGKK